jgi:hypothetical protein
VTAAAAWVVAAKETDDGLVAATIDGEGEAATAVVSEDVLTLIVFAPVAVVFVMPRISSVAAVFLASAQVWPEAFVSVIVTVVVTVAAVGVQVVTKLAGDRSTTVGVAGIVPPVHVGKATVIVPAVASAPEPLLVANPIVQCAFAPAASDVAVAVTPETDDGSIT